MSYTYSNHELRSALLRYDSITAPNSATYQLAPDGSLFCYVNGIPISKAPDGKLWSSLEQIVEWIIIDGEKSNPGRPATERKQVWCGEWKGTRNDLG